MDNYDENMLENKFLKYLRAKHEDIIDEAIHNDYIICIPKADIVQDISLDIILDHVVIPLEDVEYNKEYLTKNRNKLILDNGQLKSKEENDRKVNILFEETFYEEKIGKYKIVCIDNYLSDLFKDGNVATVQSEVLNNQTLKYFRSVNDFADHITKLTGPFLLIDYIDQLITDFLSIPFSKVNPPKADYLRREVNIMRLKSLDHIREIIIRLRDHERVTLRMCIESYIIHSLYNALFQYCTSNTAAKDEKLNRSLHSLKEINLSKFNIRVSNLNFIISAKYELAAINNFKSPFGKLQCIRKAIDCFESKNALSSDELLSILVFTIIKCNISNWFANLVFIKNYSFTLESTDEYSFILSSFEAALEFIHSEDVHRRGYEDVTSDLFFDCSEETSSFQIDNFNPKSQSHRSETIYSLYDNIKKNNLTEVKNILEIQELPKLSQNVPDKEPELCHPLCICSKCRVIVNEASNQNLGVDIDYKDENLMSPLHIAAWYGSASIVEYLLSKNANFGCQNVGGMTPLHIAACKGYQTILLLLLNAGSDINIVDKEGNTALLLSCRAGHDSCVKALIYYAESIGFNLNFRTKNIYGETALHLASYWGYTGIVKFLVSQPSAVCLMIKNMRNQTPLECAHNETIALIIKNSIENMEENTRTNLVLLNLDDENKNITSTNHDIRIDNDSPIRELKLDSATKEESSNVDGMSNTLTKIIDAIRVGDTKLACLYLEINDNMVQRIDEKFKCHPLCQCTDCSNISFVQVRGNFSLVNYIGEENYGPLHLTILNENSELCQILLQNGADPQIVTKIEKRSSLHLAVEKQNSDILKLLIKFNADVNCVDILGNTPLHLCCKSGWKDGVSILIDSGAKLSLNNKDGSSPKEEADKHGYIEIVSILIRKMSELFR